MAPPGAVITDYFLDCYTVWPEERLEEGGLGIPDGRSSKPPRLLEETSCTRRALNSKPGRELVFCGERNLDLGRRCCLAPNL